MSRCLIDGYVGLRLRERRSLLGLTQTQIARRLGVSFQQIQKYENGTSQIPAARLYLLSKVLEVDSNYFFIGIEPVLMGSGDTEPPRAAKSPIARRETIELVRLWYKIENMRLRKACIEVLRSVAANEGRRRH